MSVIVESDINDSVPMVNSFEFVPDHDATVLWS